MVTSFMSVREKITLLVLVAIFGVSAYLSIRGYVERNSHLVPQAGGIYTEAATGGPRYINPILASANDLDTDISNLIYSSLFILNDNLELEPELATEYQLSPDGLIYTIPLRHDVTWHDGQPFTAEDVVFTIRSIQTPDYGSPLAASFQGVQVEAVDDYTVRFTLTQPYAPFLTNLTIGIAPRHVWESIPPKNAPLTDQMLRPVGTGPFKFSEITTRRRTGEVTTYKLLRNDNYFGQRPLLDGITFIFFPTQEETTQALISGQADGVNSLPLSDKDAVESRNSLKIHRLTLPQYDGLFFNEIKNDRLGDSGVRAALSQAVDRERIINEARHGEANPLHLPFPLTKYNLDEEFDDPVFDPELARQNLEEAGWKDEDGDGIREKDGRRLELTITTTDLPEYIRTTEIIQEGWQEIGVSVALEHFSAGVIQQTIIGPREYEVLLYGEILTADPDPYPFWHSTRTRAPGLNFSLFKDEQTDKLLEEARRTSNQEERRQKYIEFLRRFQELNPAIILYQPYYLLGYQEDVRGLDITHADLPSTRFNNISNWHVRTERVWND